MTTASTVNPIVSTGFGRVSSTCWLVLVPLICCLSSGCGVTMPWKKTKLDAETAAADSPSLVKRPMDSFVLQGNGLERTSATSDPALQAELDTAHRLFLNKEFDKAGPLFSAIPKKKHVPVNVAEEALFYQAESLYQAKNLRDASSAYSAHLKNYRNGQHASQSIQRLFQIADYWLEPTRKEMLASAENTDKPFYMKPVSFSMPNFGKDKPFLDVEGHALQCLEEIRLNDITGPYGEQACFYLGTIKFYREDYDDADYYFTQLYQNFPNSKLAPKAIKQAIICKQIGTGGTCYDCRSVEEMRKLLDVAPTAYPSLAATDQEWLQRQLVAVNLQQADRDFNIAEFYRRTGHPGSAYFYYELVRRRYPNTEYADKAVAQMNEVRSRAEQETGGAATAALGQENFVAPQPRPAVLGTLPPQLPGAADNAPPRLLSPGVGPTQ